MAQFAADDFAFIAKRARELNADVPQSDKTPWWCDDCKREVDGHDVTFQERHDERVGGCGCIVHLSCSTCGNKGWIDQLTGGYPLIPRCECPDCHNPFRIPQP